ncbi:uncharacterized protein TRUGW13939_01733 [Talaromyces rugulosus]|uniref:Mid2 domain-containing protein n=1 Tax=Talaromyces rugulosus TaxID=121627 RepID=A0A7H8QM83_TALRU|nr:uncharacterized protein TRUGW13939_01733 [Talaromyces rugulosus]QKX54645.1 hypothetical protein TRUGW13939_01733 [Talaromyces rugulosus]
MCLGYKSLALLCSIYSPVVASGATFIDPPAYPQAGYDLATSPSYGLGSTVDIKWMIEPPRNVSLALFQLSGATSLYPYENLFSNLDAGVTSFLWTVQTAKDLGFSHNFWMCLFEENTTHAAACTNFFNITSTDAGIQAPVTTGSGLTTQTRKYSTNTQTSVPTIITAPDIVPKPIATATASSISTSGPIAMPTYIISSTSTSTATSISTPASTMIPSTPAPSGLSTLAKAGLGIGVAVGALFLAGAGFLARTHWKRWRETPIETNYITRSKMFQSPGSSTSLFQYHRTKTPLPENASGWT